MVSSSSSSSSSPTCRLLLLLGLHFCYYGTTLAIGTGNQVNNPGIDYGTFQEPSSNVRARFRYWVNDASMNLSRVAEDVRSIGKAGAGGVELVGYYLYGDGGGYEGGNDAPLQSDWTVYGWGEAAWKDLQDTVLETAEEEGLLIDLSMGPNQGAGIPAPYNDDGLLWDLVPFSVNISKGSSGLDTIPGWGGRYNADSLFTAVTGLVVSENSNGSKVTLAADSLQDVTHLVSKIDGSLNLEFESPEDGIKFVLFAFYQDLAQYREVAAPSAVATAVPQSPVQNYRQNGSWVVDHFSTAGAQLIIDFWNSSLLGDNTSEAIANVGNFLWEDSQEYMTNNTLFWTPKFADVFLANREYNISKYLPVIMSANLAGLTPFSGVVYTTDAEDAGLAHIEDYEQTLTELNGEYLTTLTDWANSLGIQFSAQVVYNLPMDMLANIPLIDGPECETLGFNHLIDGYRQLAGPANLAGKRIISSEAGAIYGEAYQQTIPELLWDLKRSIVGGVNQFVLHGFPFSGDYGNTTWPGFITFNYAFSDMHGPRQPAWEFYEEWLDWLGRVQYIAQSGVPKVDLVFWSKLTAYETVTLQYVPSDLLEAGFTYEYLSPDNFDLPDATVDNSTGTFAAERQAFKALIVRANASLTLSGVTHLVEYANAGLPVVFPGGLPTKVIGFEQAGGANLTATLETITSLDNVHLVPADGLANSLLDLGITPRTAVSANGSSWYTHWREDEKTSTQYVFVYNDATGIPLGQGVSVGNISFETTNKPFLLDAWTGEKTAVTAYSQSETATTIQLQLAGNQSVILAFEPSDTCNGDEELYISNGFAILSSTVPSSSSSSDSDSLTYLTFYTTTSQTLLLSNGSSTTLKPMLNPESTLANWNLVVESWTAPQDIYDIEAGATKTNSTPYTLSSLEAWSDISPALANVSGLGYYHSTFDWSSSSSSDSTTSSGAFIDLGAIIHTARVRINGNILPPLDPTWARADIGEYLVDGTNEVDVVVSTPLSNALRSAWSELETSGKLATVVVPVPPSVMEYGLVEEVRIIPYRRDVLAS